jgi:hypothetical protein
MFYMKDTGQKKEKQPHKDEFIEDKSELGSYDKPPDEKLPTGEALETERSLLSISDTKSNSSSNEVN